MLSKRVSIRGNNDLTKIEMQSSTNTPMPYRKSKSLFYGDSPAFRVSMDEHGFYCFEPTTLATLSGIILLVQGIMLTAVLIMATRLKGPKLLPYVIWEPIKSSTHLLKSF